MPAAYKTLLVSRERCTRERPHGPCRVTHMSKIKVEGTVVELDGDEMTRIIWKLIKEHADPPVPRHRPGLLRPRHRAPRRRPTIRSPSMPPRPSRSHGVGVKCATITPDEARVKEFSLKQMWLSPNGTIRNILGGTIFRAPIVIKNVPRLVPGWTKPIIIGRHAFGDQYRAFNTKVDKPGTFTVTFTPDDGSEPMVHDVVQIPEGGGVIMGMYNFKKSIQDFARSSFNYGLQQNYPVYLSTKNTILKGYDGMFKDEFQRIFDEEYNDEFDEQGPDLRAPADRRHGRVLPEVGGRLRVGVQELRRRRPVRHRRTGLRLTRPDDVGADDPGRQDRRGRGRARHRHPPLPPAPAGQADLDQPDRVDLRVDPRPRASRQAGQHPGRDQVRETRWRRASSARSRAVR